MCGIFFHAAAMSQSPTGMATTTPAVFLTRWITHFCAPVFLFTAGMGAYLRLARGAGSKAELSRFLLSRGAWLILLELIVMRFGFDFRFARDFPVLLITLWALGGSMVLLAGLIRMPMRWLAVSCTAVICLHNLADKVQAASFGKMAWGWNMLHQPGAFTAAGMPVIVGYPLLPLTATMGAGYCAARLFQGEAKWRQRLLRRAGIAMTAAFVLLRGINIYGDPFPWSVQRSGVVTLLSFLNCTKYPASLDFLLMTLGPALIVLVWLDRMRFSERNPLVVFGRVPLFYFVVHFYWIHVLLVLASWMRYGPAPFLFRAPPLNGRAGGNVSGALRIQPVGCVRGLGICGCDDVPGMPLVHGSKEAQTRLVAQLPVTAPAHQTVSLFIDVAGQFGRKNFGGIGNGHTTANDFAIAPGAAVQLLCFGLIVLDHCAVEGHAGESAARTRPGQNLRVQEGISVGLGVAADGSGRDVDVNSERELIGKQVLQSALIHHEQDDIGGVGAELDSQAAAGEADGCGGTPASGYAAHGKAAAVCAADQNRSLLHVRYDDDALRAFE